MILTTGVYNINLDRVLGWAFTEKFSLGREKAYCVTFYTGIKDVDIEMNREQYIEATQILDEYIQKENRKVK
jgi:hypothetical protein